MSPEDVTLKSVMLKSSEKLFKNAPNDTTHIPQCENERGNSANGKNNNNKTSRTVPWRDK